MRMRQFHTPEGIFTVDVDNPSPQDLKNIGVKNKKDLADSIEDTEREVNPEIAELKAEIALLKAR